MGNQERVHPDFFTRPADAVARELLGMNLVRKMDGGLLSGRIIETEAYLGRQDRASHAFGGKMTDRTRVLYRRGGFVYIYLVYGLHWQLNVTTGVEGEPECVLIRALETDDTDQRAASGPGKLARWLGLDRSFYGEDLELSNRLWIEPGEPVPDDSVKAAPRVGIGYAGDWAAENLRFLVKGNPAVSKKAG